MNRKNPFGLIIVLNNQGNAEGDLFFDDGESIDTVGNKSYFYAKYRWSSSDRQLTIRVLENSYPEMSHLLLDTLSIYGLEEIPSVINVNQREFQARFRPSTQIVHLTGLALRMDRNVTLTWPNTRLMPIELTTEEKYRVDCFPDPGRRRCFFLIRHSRFV